MTGLTENLPAILEQKPVKQSATHKPSRKIDVAKALELRVGKGLSYAEIGKYFGVTKQSIQQALKRFCGLLANPEQLEVYRARKINILESAELWLLKGIVDENKLKKASLNNVAYALQNIFNMTRLEKGESTIIHEVQLSPEAIQIRKAEIISEMQSRGLLNAQDIIENEPQ